MRFADRYQSLLKAVIQVKAHTRKGRGGAVAQVQAHTRVVLTSGEKADMVAKLAKQVGKGKLAHHIQVSGKGKHQVSHHEAHQVAHALAKATGKTVHARAVAGGGWHLSHEAEGEGFSVAGDGATKGHDGSDIKSAAALYDHNRRIREAQAPKPGPRPKPQAPGVKPHPGIHAVLAKVQGGPVLAQVNSQHVNVDAKSYQFKETPDKEGVTDRLRSVKAWDPIAGSTPIMVHRRKDGQLYVVDGHQRTGLARRLAGEGHQIPPMLAHIYDEDDGYTVGEMRRMGAIINIQQGTGTSMDVAKVLRERALSKDEESRIPMGSAENLQEGQAIAKLGDEAFQFVSNELLVPGNPKKNAAIAAVVAQEVEDPGQQVAILKELAKDPPAGRQEARDLVTELKWAGSSTVVQQGLFGETVDHVSLARPIAKILGHVRRTLASEKSALGNAIRNQARLEQHGSKVDAERAEVGRKSADELMYVLERFRHLAGPVGAAVQAGARGVHEGKVNERTAAANVLSALEEELSSQRRPSQPSAPEPESPSDEDEAPHVVAEGQGSLFG